MSGGKGIIYLKELAERRLKKLEEYVETDVMEKEGDKKESSTEQSHIEIGIEGKKDERQKSVILITMLN